MGFQFSMGMKDGYITAFIDLIGFSNIVMNNNGIDMTSNNEGLTINYKKMCEFIIKQFENIKDLYFLFVSDSIFICVEEDKTNLLMNTLMEICNLLLTHNIAFRGGIASGTLYADKNIWGTSVVYAVKLEKTAEMPCLIISKYDKVLIDSLSDFIIYFKPLPYNFENNNTSKTEDKYLYYDFFGHVFDVKSKDADISCFAETYQNCIMDNIMSIKDDEKCKKTKKWMFLKDELLRSIK